MSEVQAISQDTAPSTEATATAPKGPLQKSASDLLAEIMSDLGTSADDDSSEEQVVFEGDGDESATQETETEEPATEAVSQETEASALNKLATTKAKLQRLEAQELATKKRAETAESQLKELQTALKSRDEGDIFAEFERRGVTPRDWLQQIADGKLEFPTAKPKADLPPDVQEMLAEHKATKERLAKEASAKEFEAKRSDDLKQTASFIQESDYGFLKGLPGIEATIVAKFYESIEASPDSDHGELFAQVVEAAEADVRRSVETLLSNDSIIELITRSPELRDKLNKSVSQTVKQTQVNPDKPIVGTKVAGSKPTTLTSSLSNQVPTRTTKTQLTAAEMVAEINRELSAGK